MYNKCIIDTYNRYLHHGTYCSRRVTAGVGCAGLVWIGRVSSAVVDLGKTVLVIVHLFIVVFQISSLSLVILLIIIVVILLIIYY